MITQERPDFAETVQSYFQRGLALYAVAVKLWRDKYRDIPEPANLYCPEYFSGLAILAQLTFIPGLPFGACCPQRCGRYCFTTCFGDKVTFTDVSHSDFSDFSGPFAW